ncbi:MAG: hypothetical protein QM664_11965 [Flavihumibacter sp.]
MKHLFFDTNVILDLLGNRQPFAGPASLLFDYADKGKIAIYISSLSYSNIYYTQKTAYPQTGYCTSERP